MTKSYCDRCNEEILDLPFILKAGSKSYDLCQDCKKKFEDYMKMETFK